MHNEFSYKLIKGKITEIVFEQMFKEMEKFILIPFGYESTLPEIAQASHKVEYQYVLDQIRTAPDFAMVSHDKTEVFLVEVKYLHTRDEEKIKEIAENIHRKWKVVWLFIATPEGFFFDSCLNIINAKGKILSLATNWVNRELQDKFLLILTDFIK